MPTICLEVKPKWGVLATSPCIHPKHSIKLRVPRFQLHQQLKAAQVPCLSRTSSGTRPDYCSGHISGTDIPC